MGREGKKFIQSLKEEMNRVKAELPLVTIITPAYNRASFLDETIQSVLSQDYPRIEYIVLDDGSADNTCEILKKYQGKIYWESNPNMGETHTVNKGFKMAKGEIVCVVNSDDPLLPGAIRAAVTLMQEAPDVLAAYPDWNEIGPHSELIRRIQLPDYDLVNMLTTFNVSMGPGTFIRRYVFDTVGMRDPQFKYAGDLEFWFRLALHGRMAHIPETLATHRTHPDSASVSGRGPRMAEELLRLVEKLFVDPNLPPVVQRLRNRVLGAAYYKAVFFCGSEKKAFLKYFWMAMRYDPFYTPWRVLSEVCLPVYRRVSHRIQRALWHKWSALRQLFLRKDGDKTTNKIAFISHVLPPSWSGQAVVIARLFESVNPERYCLISRQNYDAAEATNNLPSRLPGRYYHLSPEFQLGRWNRYGVFRLVAWLKVLHRASQIAHILKKERPHAIAACSGDLYDPLAAYLASRWLGIRYYLYVFDDYVYQWPTPMYRSFAKTGESIVMKGTTKVILPNEFLCDEYRRRYGIEPVVIHNPCDESSISFEREIPWPANKGEIKIVYTGAIYHAHYDAFRNLLLALQKIGHPLIRLHVYTAQNYEWLKEHQICGPVVYHDHLSSSQVAQIQREADILFLPLAFHSPIPEVIKTSAPGKMGEYMATGRPILVHAPSDSFLSWYFKKHRCGLVEDREDPAALGTAIHRILDDPGLRQLLRKNSLMRARIDFSQKTAQAEFLKLVQTKPEELHCASSL